MKHHLPDGELNQTAWRERRVVTPRLVVRAFQPEDAGHLYEYLSNAEIYQFEPGDPVDRQQAVKRAEEMSSSWNFWAVELQAEGKVIGQIYFEHVEPLYLMTWELGYILSPHYQRQGYASEAAAALVGVGFAAAGIHRVVAHCSSENMASWKLLEKIGFRREGLLKKNVFFRRDGKGEPLWMDSFVYARLADDDRLGD